MGYWRSGEASPWVTMRSALLLQTAVERGYRVPEPMLAGLSGWARRMVETGDPNRTTIVAMGLRHLARTGDWMEPQMETLLARRSELDLEARLHLADAFYTVGRDDVGETLLDTIAIPEPRLPTGTGRFHSDLTDTALALEILLDRRPADPIIPELADRLIRARGDAGWRTTYEDASIVRALVEWFLHAPAPGGSEGSIRIAGRSVTYGGAEDGHVSFPTTPGSMHEERIVNDGPGEAHVRITTSGVPVTALDPEPVTMGISVRRRWLDAAGDEITAGTPLMAGDLVTVEVTARAEGRTSVPNVAIVEVLPGGMEFELPSLATSAPGPGQGQGPELNRVENVDFRDDRLIAFTGLGPEPSVIRYVIRAIVPGTWSVPPPDALAMYDRDIRAHGRVGSVEIREP